MFGKKDSGWPNDTNASDGYAVSSGKPTSTKASDGYTVGTSDSRNNQLAQHQQNL